MANLLALFHAALRTTIEPAESASQRVMMLVASCSSFSLSWMNTKRQPERPAQASLPFFPGAGLAVSAR